MPQPPLDRFSESRDRFLDVSDADLERERERLEGIADQKRDREIDKESPYPEDSRNPEHD